MDTLVSIGILAAWGWSAIALALFEHAHSYVEVAAVTTTLVLTGRVLEAGARRRAGDALRGLLDLAVRQVRVRDEATGELWSPTAQPIRDGGTYVARHGHGYSRFEHTANGIELDLLQDVPLEDPIKITRLTLRNLSRSRRRLSVTAYAEWVLGVARTGSAPFVVTRIDPITGAMLAHNAWNEEFTHGVAFADMGGRQTAWTGDRLEFLGRNASLDQPASLRRGAELSGTVGAGLDPCENMLLEQHPGTDLSRHCNAVHFRSAFPARSSGSC